MSLDDPNQPADPNPFDQIDQGQGHASDNPFDSIGPDLEPGGSATGAFARSAAKSALPAAGGLVAAGAGAEIGGAMGALGGPAAPVTVPVGAFAGGVAGMLFGSAAVAKVQDWALSKFPDSWTDAMAKQERSDETAHPIASFIGGLAPYALTMRPGLTAATKLPENATAFQRILANPVTARLFGGAAMGGMELGQEAVEDPHISWPKVAISTGFGVMFNKPTRIGEAITSAGPKLARRVFGRPEATAPPETERQPATIAQAADAKVMGPGITEQVFQGAHEQDTSAALTAQEAARTEQTFIGPPAPGPDIHNMARRMDPDLFNRYDELQTQRATFQGWIDEGAPEEAPVAQRHLAAIELEMRQLDPEVSAAYRRAAEATGAQTVESAPPVQPAQFTSMAAMLAARGEAPSTEVAAQPAAESGLPPARTIEQQRDFISQDVARQLTAAGRPAEEAQAAGQLVAARYETRAARFNGALGTAEDLYRKEGAQIRGQGGAPSPATPAPTSAPPQGAIDASHDVVSGANSSKDPNGPVYIDHRIPEFSPTLKDSSGQPANLWKYLALHERTEAKAMASGVSYDDAHTNTATPAERAAVEADGVDWKAYTHEIDGYLSKIENEKAENPPPDTHVDPEAAIGHHRSENKQGEPAEVHVRQRAKVGPAARPESTWSLLEFLADRGGLKADDPLIADVKSSIGRDNRFVPGFGQLIRKNGMSLDKARETAVEAGYLFDMGEHTGGVTQSTINHLLDAIGEDANGNRVYRSGTPAPEPVLAQEQEPPHVPTSDDIWNRFLAQRQERDTSSRIATGFNDFRTRSGGAPLRDRARQNWETGNVVDVGFVKDLLISEKNADGTFTLLSKPNASGMSQSYTVRPHEGLVKAERVDFLDAAKQILPDYEFAQDARGKIRLLEGRRPIITLMRDANASTFIHESGHQYLEELMRDANHPQAPEDLKTDASTVKSWLSVGEDGALKTSHHEKFARGFEQYLREGIAPSPQLASVFAKFKNWLLNIYQTIKGLGQPINEDIKGVFDRMLSTEPQRTVIAPERAKGPTLADIHKTDANLTEPHEAEPRADLIGAEATRYATEPPLDIAHEITKAESETEAAIAAARAGPEPGGEAVTGTAEPGQVDHGGAEPEPEPEGGGVGQGRSNVVSGGARPETEGPGVSAGAGPEPVKGPRDQPLAPSPAPSIGPRESPFLDKAGNIRVENLTTREDVAQAIRDAAAANNDFIGDRRGVITDGQVMDLADALGMDFNQLNLRKLGQAFNAEQIGAARKLLLQSAADVGELMHQAAIGTDEDVMAYAQAKDRHQMIQAQVAGITAEAGRALRAFRNIAGQETAQGVDQFLRTATGKTLFQLKQEAKLGAALQTPQQVSKMMLDAQKRSYGRMIMEFFVNNLISGPATHVTYTVGNMGLLMEKIGLVTPVAAGIGRFREAFGRQGERVHGGEVVAGARGALEALPAAIRAVGQAARAGTTVQLPGEVGRQTLLPFQPGTELAPTAVADLSTSYSDLVSDSFGMLRGLRDGFIATGGLLKAGGIEGEPWLGASYSHLGVIPDITVHGINVLPLGSAVRLPSRMVASIHSFFRVLNYAVENNQQAWRAASNEGLEGSDFAARVADLRQNPSEQSMERSRTTANDLTLMGQGGAFMRKVSALFNWETNLPILGSTQPLKFIDPFVQISGQVMKQAIGTQTPLGLFSAEVRADISGKNGNVAQDLATAKMLVGSALGLTFGGLAAQGYMSGSGPVEPNKAAMWRLAGNQPHSIRIGDIWYQVNRLGPLGLLASTAADMYDVAHTASQEDMQHAAALFMHAVSQNFLDEGFMRGPADLLKAVEESNRYGDRYVQDFLSSFVPYSVGMAQMARASDPYSRQVRSLMDAIKAKVPGLSEDLWPRRDIWGEPMLNPDAFGHAGVTAVYERKMSTDPVNLAMLNLGIAPAMPERKIRNVTLTDAQYDDFARIAGRMTKMRLDAIVRSSDYQGWPNQIRHTVIEETIRQSREAATGTMMMKFPQIARDATQAKLQKLGK